jgi:hypothetical protein
LKDKGICINCANLELESCNKDRIIKCSYCNSGRHKNLRDLQKLEKALFYTLINISDDSDVNKKYVNLAKFLVQRIDNQQPTPFFYISLEDIPIDIKRELMQIAEPELNVLMDNLIDRIFEYSFKDETYFDCKYFVNKVRKKGLLKGRLVKNV